MAMMKMKLAFLFLTILTLSLTSSSAARERRGAAKAAAAAASQVSADTEEGVTGFLSASTILPESAVPLELHEEDLASTLASDNDTKTDDETSLKATTNTTSGSDSEAPAAATNTTSVSDAEEKAADTDSDSDSDSDSDESDAETTEDASEDNEEDTSSSVDISSGAALLTAIDASTFLNFDTLYSEVHTAMKRGVRKALKRLVDEEEEPKMKEKLISSVVDAAYDDVTAMSMELLFKDVDMLTFWGSLDEARSSITLPPLNLLPLFVEALVPVVEASNTTDIVASLVDDDEVAKRKPPVVTEDDTHTIVITDLLAKIPAVTPTPIVATLFMKGEIVNNTISFMEVADNNTTSNTTDTLTVLSLMDLYMTLKKEAASIVAHNVTDLETRFYTIREELGNDGKTYIAEAVAEAEALEELQVEDEERERAQMTLDERIAEINQWSSALHLNSSIASSNATYAAPLASTITDEVYKLTYNMLASTINETFTNDETSSMTTKMTQQALHSLTTASLMRFTVSDTATFQRSYLPAVALVPIQKEAELVEIVDPSRVEKMSSVVPLLQVSGGWSEYPSTLHIFVATENVEKKTMETLVAEIEKKNGVALLGEAVAEDMKLDDDALIIARVSVLKALDAPIAARATLEELLSRDVQTVIEGEDISDDEETSAAEEKKEDVVDENATGETTTTPSPLSIDDQAANKTSARPGKTARGDRERRGGRKLQSTETCVNVNGFQEGCEPINNFGSFGCRTSRDILPAALDGIYRFEGMDLEGWPVYAKPASLEYAQIVNKYLLSRTVQSGIFPDTLGDDGGSWATILPNEPTFRLAFESGQIPFAFTPSTRPPQGCTSPDKFPACLDGLRQAWLFVSPETECNGQRASRNTLCSWGRFTITFEVTDCPRRNPNAIDTVDSAARNDFVGTPLSQPTRGNVSLLPSGGGATDIQPTRRPRFASGGQGPNNDLKGGGRAVGLRDPITYPGGSWFSAPTTTVSPAQAIARSRAAASRPRSVVSIGSTGAATILGTTAPILPQETTLSPGIAPTTTVAPPVSAVEPLAPTTPPTSPTSIADLLRIEVPWRPTTRDPDAPATTTIFPAGGGRSSSFPSFTFPSFFSILSRMVSPSVAETEVEAAKVAAPLE